MDPATPDDDSCTQISKEEEEEEYLKTIDLLINKLMETEDRLKEAIDAKLEAEERLRQIEAPRGSAQERVFAAQEARRLAEMDLRAQIEEKNHWEGLYYAQWRQKTLIQEELTVCKRELDDARIRIAELQHI